MSGSICGIYYGAAKGFIGKEFGVISLKLQVAIGLQFIMSILIDSGLFCPIWLRRLKKAEFATAIHFS